jgi:aminopeptidase N
MVAVFDEYGWREDVVTSGLDYAYTESALMAVNLRAPTEVMTWFTGALKSSQADDTGRTTYTVVTGPMRNFIVIQAESRGTLEISGGPVPVRVMYTGSEENARLIGTIAKDSLTWFDANLGHYPYAALDVVAVSFPSGGEEYPSLVFVNNDPERGPIYWRWITAHEVAHQWFYGIAGNDTIRHAWLDESMVQVAGWLFHLDTLYGSNDAPDVYWSHVLTWYNRIQGPPKVLETPPEGYAGFDDFMSTIYGGGAAYMRELAELIGPDVFARGLHAYVTAVSFGIGTPQQFFDAMQAQTSQDLRPFFCQRVGIMC